LYALERGIHVFGASSMGALRAAETDMYGTIGVGEIYRMFAEGELDDDDEVALAHGSSDDGYRPLSEALVNVRATLKSAVASGVIDASLAACLIDCEKSVFFPERSYRHMFETAAAAGEDLVSLERLREFVRTSRVDQKRLDAIALLERIRDLPRPLAPHVPSFELEWTGNFKALYDQDRKVLVDDTEIPLAAIHTHAALHAPNYLTLNAQALDRSLMPVLADMLGITASPDEVTAENRRFCVERQLGSSEALVEWRRQNNLSAEDFAKMMLDQARRRILHRWLIHRRSYVGTTRLVLDELRLRGDYQHWARRAVEYERLLADRSIDDDIANEAARADDERLTNVELAVDHIRATPCRMPMAYHKWADETGILLGRLRIDLLRARDARRRTARQLDRLVDVGPA
ncbi:MAG: TfuA-like protein, partial [bacterium]